jgi:hypothetical protein
MHVNITLLPPTPKASSCPALTVLKPHRRLLSPRPLRLSRLSPPPHPQFNMSTMFPSPSSVPRLFTSSSTPTPACPLRQTYHRSASHTPEPPSMSLKLQNMHKNTTSCSRELSNPTHPDSGLLRLLACKPPFLPNRSPAFAMLTCHTHSLRYNPTCLLSDSSYVTNSPVSRLRRASYFAPSDKIHSRARVRYACTCTFQAPSCPLFGPTTFPFNCNWAAATATH